MYFITNEVIIKLHFRQATLHDAPFIAEILIESQWFTYKNIFDKVYIQRMIDNYYNIKRIEEEICQVSSKWNGYYVAEDCGSILGVIGGGMINNVAAEVYVFYMNPQLRGKGIGTRLLNFFTKIQKHKYGANEQWVAVAKGNEYGIPFYEARGFIFQSEELSYGTSPEELDISLKYKRSI